MNCSESVPSLRLKLGNIDNVRNLSGGRFRESSFMIFGKSSSANHLCPSFSAARGNLRLLTLLKNLAVSLIIRISLKRSAKVSAPDVIMVLVG